jgi:DNA polymerase III delta subunit
MAAPLRYGDWERRCAQEGPAAATLFCGPETLLRDQALLLIKVRLFGSGEKSRLGHDRFYGGEGALAPITTALASVGLFTGTRLVTVTDVEKFGRAPAVDRRELIERLAQGLIGSVFVALSQLSAWELERKNDLARELLRVCQVVELSHPTPAEAMRWLLEASQRRGIRLQAEAGEYLLSRIGPNLQELSRELEKLELAATPGESVGLPEVEEMVRRGQLGTAWNFCDRLLAGNPAAALRLWSAVGRTEPVMRVQWLLQRQARDQLGRRGSSGPEDSLRRVLSLAYDLEFGIKSGRIPSGLDDVAMEIVAASCGAGRTRPARHSSTAK